MHRSQAAKIFLKKVRDLGFLEAVRRSVKFLIDRKFPPQLPLERALGEAMFSTSTDSLRAEEKKQARASTLLFDASHVEDLYSEVFEYEGRFMRYAFLPAEQESKGLVVSFHGHNAFFIIGLAKAWKHFDVLAPWDTFGFNRQGSWYWGEKGDNFVEILTQQLIEKVKTECGSKKWYSVGASMGGFAAIYHGIKHGASGIYAGCPQIDLRLKIQDYGNGIDNPYGFLQGDRIETVPDICELAEKQPELPPLYIVQNQYDAVNPFAQHAFNLLEIYNRKKAWYGARIHPAIGHRGDFDEREADLFFNLIDDRSPPYRFPG